VACLQEQREDVVTLRQVTRSPSLGDLLVDRPVHARDVALEKLHANQALRTEQRWKDHHARVGHHVQQAPKLGSQPQKPFALGQAKDRAKDDLQGQCLHPRAQAIRLVTRPTLDLGACDLGHELAVALHALAVKGRQQELSLLQVGALVEQQDGMLAEHREQNPVPLTGVVDARIAGEDLFDVDRMRQHDPGSLVEDPQPERVAKARRALPKHPLCVPEPDRRLQRRRHPRAGRQSRERVHGHATASEVRVRHLNAWPRNRPTSARMSCRGRAR